MANSKVMQRLRELEDAVARLFSGEGPAPDRAKGKTSKRKVKKAAKKTVRKVKKAAKKTVRKVKRKANR